MTIAMAAATGHIGSQLVRLLLNADADLVLLVRDPGKLPPDVRENVRVEKGEIQDPEYVRRATRGAKTLFWATAVDPYSDDLHAWYDLIGTNVASAVRENGIKHVLNISSAGAQLPDAGPATGQGHIERLLNETDAAVMHFRPALFMENMVSQAHAMRQYSAFFTIAPGNVPLPHIATRDIAKTAAGYLLDPTWHGKQIRGLHGPADLTYQEIATIYSDLAGRTIEHTQITPEQAYNAYTSAGMKPAVTRGFIELETGLSRPSAVAEPRTPDTTTQTTYLDWASEVMQPKLR